ncbi:4Fe-4S dicluster-binding protein [Selenihalanaerobacter shriftii]|uniref:Ferredoxin n=1 Tax=Selenihalanaerobacter shriftii TaxID=142842 RepID=A0A1T4M4I9_9FIRM|nr:4Fe-4S dicluster domain-containing protein [Selenihalanaerobacter shriftii]SJZ61842.1 4Fe-4S dicluster domain-containing protein [Selenihalanaerobacter shriftii]
MNDNSNSSIFTFNVCSGIKRNCPNVILDAEELKHKLKEIITAEDLSSYLIDGHKGRILPHFKFRIGIAGCPNGCSRPQVMDLSLLARIRPKVEGENCISCGKCVDACKETAIKLNDDKIPVVNYERCFLCGDCIKSCPVNSIIGTKQGWSFAIGGKLGRHPQFAIKLSELMSTEKIMDIFPDLIKFYNQQRKGKEKLALVVNRLGIERIREELL